MSARNLDIKILKPTGHLTDGLGAMKYSLLIFLIAALLNFSS